MQPGFAINNLNVKHNLKVCIYVPAAMQWCHFLWSNCKKSSFGSDESQAGFQLWGRRSRWMEKSEKEKIT